MIGTRFFTHKFGGLLLQPGGFGRDIAGRWWVRPPGRNSQVIRGEHVVEHPDATVTVRVPINGGATSFRLEHGVWNELTEKETP